MNPLTSQATAWVFSEKSELYPELIAGAAQMGKEVRVFVLSTRADALQATLGANKIYLLEDDETRMMEDHVPGMAAVIAQEGPAVVLFGATRRGKAMAVRLGVALGAAVINDITTFSREQTFTVSRMIYGGLACGCEEVCASSVVLTVGTGVFEASASANALGETVTLPFAEPVAGITRLERRPRENSTVDLTRAKRVVSVGRGLKAQEDLQMVNELADSLHAEVGCSRPLAEGENWLERERYVGVTGSKLKADVYLALGISGQIQHMVGVSGTRTLFAVNKDKNAPIFKNVDYGLVGDIYDVVPALTTLLKE